MKTLDLVALVHNALTVSNARWVKVDYRHIFDTERGLANKIVGTVVEIDDGHQWVSLIYRVDPPHEERDDEFVVESIDQTLLKGLVHVRQGMDQCKGTLNRFLDVVLDRVRHHNFSTKLVTPVDNVQGRNPSIIRFTNEEGVLTIARMGSAQYAMAKYNVEQRRTMNGRPKGFWESLRLRWHRKP